MNLSISQIAWKQIENAAIGKLLESEGITLIDIAPSMQWPRPDLADSQEINDWKLFWRKYEIKFYAMQSILYKRPDLTIFASSQERQQTLNYIKKIINLAEALEIRRIVFGSPENRRKGNLDESLAREIALDFFAQIADYCRYKDLVFCLEANPVQYGCDFINTTDEALGLVEEVNNPNFKVNLDVGGSLLNDFNFDSLSGHMANLGYIHISEPSLQPVQDIQKHTGVGSRLKAAGYNGVYGIEMRRDDSLPVEQVIRRAINLAKEAYG